MNYTKGEWRLSKSLAGDWVISTDDELIAREVRHFNAPLISAAPGLYESGKNALVSLKLWANEHPDDEVLTMVITQLEYSIAKAEGKC